MNTCKTCNHKKNPDGGHCYMLFKNELSERCMQHTGFHSLKRQFSDKALTKILFDIYDIIKH
jgi:hypothetical protein